MMAKRTCDVLIDGSADCTATDGDPNSLQQKVPREEDTHGS